MTQRLIIVTADKPGDAYELWRLAIKGTSSNNKKKPGWDEVKKNDVLELVALRLDNRAASILSEKKDEEKNDKGSDGEANVEDVKNIITNYQITEPTSNIFIAAHLTRTFTHIRNLDDPPRLRLKGLSHETHNSFYNLVHEFITRPSNDLFDAIVSKITEPPRPSEQLGALQHKFNNFWEAITTLDGWETAGFPTDYGRWGGNTEDGLEDLADENLVKKYELTRRLFYNPEERPCVREIVEASLRNHTDEETQSITTKWCELQILVPSASGTAAVSDPQLRRAKALWERAWNEQDSLIFALSMGDVEGARKYIEQLDALPAWQRRVNDLLCELYDDLHALEPPDLEEG